MILSLGVIDLPYVDQSGVSTGDVAEILEAEYGVMAAFVDLHEADIVDAVEKSIAGSLETMLMGGPVSNPFAGAESSIEAEFREFLDREEMAQVAGIAGHAGGVPTKAALMGVNPRLKKRRGARRPSFIATGMYQSSMKAEFK